MSFLPPLLLLSSCWVAVIRCGAIFCGVVCDGDVAVVVVGVGVTISNGFGLELPS